MVLLAVAVDEAGAAPARSTLALAPAREMEDDGAALEVELPFSRRRRRGLLLVSSTGPPASDAAAMNVVF